MNGTKATAAVKEIVRYARSLKKEIDCREAAA
jgi:hypothetical protein